MIEVTLILNEDQIIYNYDNNSLEEIFSEYKRLISSELQFICINNNHNKTIIRKDKINFINIREINNEKSTN